jgi:hypothetical protein
MSNEIYIYHHLGLGDHLICNAIVRKYANMYDTVFLFVKPHNLNSVKFMYNDLNNVQFISGDDNFVNNYIISNNITNLIKIGFVDLGQNKYFDETFYKLANYDFSNRWLNFKVNRSKEKEKELFDKFKIKENEYVFLHDDSSRGYVINQSYIENKELPIITPVKGLTDNIFDYCYLLENAKELHCIDSSFRLLADSINIKSDILYYHLSYVGRGYYISSSKNNWKIV